MLDTYGLSMADWLLGAVSLGREQSRPVPKSRVGSNQVFCAMRRETAEAEPVTTCCNVRSDYYIVDFYRHQKGRRYEVPEVCKCGEIARRQRSTVRTWAQLSLVCLDPKQLLLAFIG